MNNESKGLEFNLDNPALSSAKNCLDGAICQCLRELYKGKFESGVITLKLNIELIDDEEINTVTSDKHSKEKSYKYKRPAVKYRTSLSFKDQRRVDGEYMPESVEVKLINNRFVLAEVRGAQLSLSDTENDKKQ